MRGESTSDVLDHHLKSFAEYDVDGVRPITHRMQFCLCLPDR